MLSSFTLRNLKAFARASIIPPQPPYAVVPMATFRTYAAQESPQDATKNKGFDKGSNQNTEQTSSAGPTTDDVAHSDAAYGGGSANPQDSAKQIENEKSGSMEHSAANPDASKPPNKPSDRPAPKEY